MPQPLTYHRFRGAVCALILSSTAPILPAQHAHIIAGAVAPRPGTALAFINAADFEQQSGYVKSLPMAEIGPYAGYYQGSLNPIALFDGELGAAARGALIELEILSVDGPEGATFDYWEPRATSPTVKIATGTTSSLRFPLSDHDGSAAADPGGHIHGRRFTVSATGLYSVTFRLVDTSVNGDGGGPIHSPSSPLTIRFQAGFHVLRVLPRAEDSAEVLVAAPALREFQLEATDRIQPHTEWEPVGAPFTGEDALHFIIDDRGPSPIRIYRMRELGL